MTNGDAELHVEESVLRSIDVQDNPVRESLQGLVSIVPPLRESGKLF